MSCASTMTHATPPIRAQSMARFTIAIAFLAAACQGPRDHEHSAMEVDRLKIDTILQAQRQAHLRTDADLLVEHIAENLLSVDAGQVTPQSREEIRQMFASYFEGALYHAWEDLEPPVIRVSSDGSMAWVVRRVRVDREEPDGAGGRRRREFTSAYTSTFEKIDGEWWMTSVCSTFEPASSAVE